MGNRSGPFTAIGARIMKKDQLTIHEKWEIDSKQGGVGFTPNPNPRPPIKIEYEDEKED